MLLTNLYTGIPQGRSMPVCAGQHAGLCKWVDTGLMWFNTLVHEALAKFPLNTVSTKQYLMCQQNLCSITVPNYYLQIIQISD